MINIGKLSYTSTVCKELLGRIIKVIDTSELIRVFGSLDGVIDDVKWLLEQNLQSISSVGLRDLQLARIAFTWSWKRWS